jgi:hypothetical protein
LADAYAEHAKTDHALFLEQWSRCIFVSVNIAKTKRKKEPIDFHRRTMKWTLDCTLDCTLDMKGIGAWKKRNPSFPPKNAFRNWDRNVCDGHEWFARETGKICGWWRSGQIVIRSVYILSDESSECESRKVAAHIWLHSIVPGRAFYVMPFFLFLFVIGYIIS